MFKHPFILGAACALVTATLGAKEPTSQCEHCGQNLSNAFVRAAEKGRPAVVHIRTELSGTPAAYEAPFDQNNPFEHFHDELFNHFFGQPQGRSPHQRTPRELGSGSGFFVSQEGYILTNHHVIKDASKIYVETFEQNVAEYEAQLIGCDPNTDLALLKIQRSNCPFLELADSDVVQVGQWTLAIGHPFKLRDSVTAGIVSATNRGNLQISKLEDFIQIDASINPGNSGGPLVDLDCRVIGVNTAILSRSGGSIGVGFAVPANICRMVYEQLRENGTVDRGFIGVQIQDLSNELCEGFHLEKGTTGAVIAEVVEDSPAAKFGLEPGDVVVEFNRTPIKNAQQLMTTIGKLAAGTSCEIAVLRKGQKKTLKIKLGSNVREVSCVGDIVHQLGLMVEQITPENAQKLGVRSEERGVVITKVLPQSVASRAGCQTGQVIIVANGQKVTNVQELKEVLTQANPKERIVLLLHQKGRATFISVPHPNA